MRSETPMFDRIASFTDYGVLVQAQMSSHCKFIKTGKIVMPCAEWRTGISFCTWLRYQFRKRFLSSSCRTGM